MPKKINKILFQENDMCKKTYIFFKSFDKKIADRNRFFVSEILIGMLLGGLSLLVFAASIFLVYFAVKKAKEIEHGEESLKEEEHKDKINEANKNNGKVADDLWKDDENNKNNKAEENNENITENIKTNSITNKTDGQTKIAPTINANESQTNIKNNNDTAKQFMAKDENHLNNIVNNNSINQDNKFTDAINNNHKEPKKMTSLTNVNQFKNKQKNNSLSIN